MNKIFLLSFLSFTLTVISGHAQQYLGIATGSYCRMYSMYLNPANLADTTERATLNLLAFNVWVDNNLGTFPSIGNISKTLNSNDSNSQSIFTNSGRKNFSMVAPGVNIHGPSLLVSLNKKHAIGITTGLRVINQFNNFDQSLYTTSTSNNNNIANTNYSISTQKFNWTAHMWNEIGISYAGIFIDQPEQQLKVGVTVRRLGGVGYISLKGNNLDLKYFSGSDSFYASHSDLEFASNIVSAQSAVFNGINSGNLLNRFFGASEGVGVGGDIGAVYSHRFGSIDSTSSSTHNLVVSASVTDIGAINYNKNSNAIINVSGNGYLTGNGLSNNVSDFTSFKNYMLQQGFTADTSSAATKLHMPTALILSADYQLMKHFYVNGTFIGNLANRQNFGNSYYDRFTITPRYDRSLISIAIPVSYSWLAQDIKAGLGLRFGSFFIGSDDMLALFSNHQYGFNVYMGGYIPVKFRKKRRLEDHDHYERIVQ